MSIPEASVITRYARGRRSSRHLGLILVANYPTILPLVRKEADKSL